MAKVLYMDIRCPKCLGDGVNCPKNGNAQDYVGPPCECEAGKRLVVGGGARCPNCETPVVPPLLLESPCPECGLWLPADDPEQPKPDRTKGEKANE